MEYLDKKGSLDKLGKFISLVLRHKPDEAGIELDGHGWADAGELLAGINSTGRTIDMEILEEVVRTDSKQRFAFNSDKTRIRACQGHSIPVDLELEERQPPEFLYHGTASRFIGSIEKEGLRPMGRQYVHLSKDLETAKKVGERHGVPVILKIHSGDMYRDGCRFYLSENGVWLASKVAVKYLERVGEA